MADDEISLRTIGPDDLGSIIELHRKIHQSLSDVSFLYLHDAKFFETMITSDGVVIGAFSGGRLVAYGAVILPGAKSLGRNYALAHLNVENSQLAFGAGCGVHPSYRRGGLFKSLIQERTRQAFLHGATHVTAVVSPRNDTSLRVLHELGHAAVGIHHDDDGENFLLVTPATAGFTGSLLPIKEVPLADIESNLRTLRGSCLIGYPGHRDGAPVYSYMIPAQDPAATLAAPHCA